MGVAPIGDKLMVPDSSAVPGWQSRPSGPPDVIAREIWRSRQQVVRKSHFYGSGLGNVHSFSSASQEMLTGDALPVIVHFLDHETE